MKTKVRREEPSTPLFLQLKEKHCFIIQKFKQKKKVAGDMQT